MRRSGLGLDAIATIETLGAAFHAAARGKRGRPEVEAFRADLDRRLAELQEALTTGHWRAGPLRSFRIRDPKPRLIHAPCFADRVVHHAVMAHVGPVLDRSLIFDTYACRIGKGTLAAVLRAGAHCRRHAWFAQIDMRAYFASIDHAVLSGLLRRKFKHPELLDLLDRLIRTPAGSAGRGLPIGSLTSQHFANFYLGGLDRVLVEGCRVAGFVRYMDDLVWWTPDRAAARAALDVAASYLRDVLHLEVKRPVRIGRSRHGLSFCGFRILPDRLLLSRRRRKRYAALRRKAERAWLGQRLDGPGLQSAYASALALTVHGEAAAWRRAQMRRVPVAAPLEDV